MAKLNHHIDPASAGLGSTRRPPLSASDLDFARSRRALGASWSAIGRMLGNRYADDVRRACEGELPA